MGAWAWGDRSSGPSPATDPFLFTSSVSVDTVHKQSLLSPTATLESWPLCSQRFSDLLAVQSTWSPGLGHLPPPCVVSQELR